VRDYRETLGVAPDEKDRAMEGIEACWQKFLPDEVFPAKKGVFGCLDKEG